ncbi:hypothetical protein WG909_04490 [Peptostreptococcaceae bacterium AGR-M142]
MDNKKLKIIFFILIVLIISFNVWYSLLSGRMESPNADNIRLWSYCVYGILFLSIVYIIYSKKLKNKN